MRIVTLLAFTVVTFISLEAPAQIYFSHGRHFVVNEDGGTAAVDVIERNRDGWPRLVRRRLFDRHETALAFVRGRGAKRFFLSNAPSARPLTDLPGVSLWAVTESWNWTWELRFAEWVRSEFDSRFFQRHNLATDCADVAYALRWIFARMNGLPVAARLASGNWVTQDSVKSEWMNLPTATEWYRDQRFLAALNFLLDFTYTHTLLADSYPVEIVQGSLMEGGFHLALHGSSGHTRPIYRVTHPEENGLPLTVIMSTVPRAVRELFQDGFWDASGVDPQEGGFLRFRWPDGNGAGLIPAEQMPHYSLEQYRDDFKEPGELFFLAVYRRLKPDFSLDALAEQLINGTQAMALDRQTLVRDGFAFCAQNDCEPGTPGWEAWSTPSRDHRLADQLNLLQRAGLSFPGPVLDKLHRLMQVGFLNEGGRTYSLAELDWAWSNETYSVDPRDPPEFRWGLMPRAVRQSLVKRIAETWTQREAFLRSTSNCPETECVPGTPAWKAKSSLKYDVDLVVLGPIPDTYCARMPETDCRQLRAAIQDPFDVVQPGLTIESTLFRLLAVNSDPRHSIETRRYGTAGLLLPLPLPDPTQTRSNGDLLIDDVEFPGNMRIFRLTDRGRAQILPPSDSRWLGANLDPQVAWFESPEGIGFSNLATGAETRSDLPLEGAQVAISADGHALLLGPAEWRLLVNKNGAIQVAAHGPHDTFRKVSRGVFLVRVRGSTKLATVAGDRVRMAPADGAPMESSEGEIFRETELGWYFRDAAQDLWLLTRDGRVHWFGPGSRPLLIEDSGRSLVILNGNQDFLAVNVSDAGTVTSSRLLPYANFATWPNERVSASENGQRVTYLIRDRQLARIETRGDEYEVVDAKGEFVVSMGDGGTYVRRESETSPMFRTDGFTYFEASQSQPLLVMCDNTSDDFRSWLTGCRLTDPRHVERFSLFTGLSAMGIYYRERSDELGRGFVARIGMVPVWFDLRAQTRTRGSGH